MKKLILITVLSLITYFSQAQTIYVNTAASGLNDGTSWVNAYNDLQIALSSTASGEIWVAAGTYYTGISGDNAATYNMKNGVAIYGGFNGTETLLTQRDVTVNLTTLSGDLDFSGTYTGNDAYHVVTTGSTNSTAILDGFTITGGNANGGGATAVGGGIYCDPTIGGAYNPIIRNCNITGNNAAADGAGMYINCDQTGGNSTGPSIHNCKFNANVALGNGGAIYITATGSLTFTTPYVENCTFYNNSAGGAGHHIAAQNNVTGEVHASVIGCTFAGNAAGSEIYYLANGINGTFDIHNSIFFGLDIATDDFYNANNNCGDPTYLIGSGNINVDPLFMNAGAYDYRLACFSPCFETGSNTYPTLSTDITSALRIF